MTYGSLFSGVGGFDLGFDRAGMRCQWQVEIDPRCRSVLRREWPGVVRLDDINGCRGGDLKGGNLPRVDLVCGGFPCQDVSVAGKRGGLYASRTGLFWQMMRVIGELQPRIVVWENVPGLHSSPPAGVGVPGTDFLAVLAALDELGYDGAWSTLDARHFGLAQMRARIFGVFVAGHPGAGPAAEVLALAARLSGNPAPSGPPREDLAAGLRSRSASRGVNLPGRGGEDDRNLAFAVRPDPGAGNANNTTFVPEHLPVSGGGGTYDQGASGLRVMALPQAVGALSARAAYDRGDGADVLIPQLANGLRADDSYGYRGDGGDAVLAVPLTGHCGSVSQREDDVNLVPAVTSKWAKGSGGPAGSETGNLTLAATVRSNVHNNSDPMTEGAMLERIGVRRLTPTECERLQGFPDGWTATGWDGKAIPDTQRYKMLGNAVPPPMAEWIGTGLVRILTGEDGR